MRKYFLYKDDLHGYQAVGTCTNTAWALIRNKCHDENKEVPTMDRVKLVRELDNDEVKALFKSQINEQSTKA